MFRFDVEIGSSRQMRRRRPPLQLLQPQVVDDDVYLMHPHFRPQVHLRRLQVDLRHECRAQNRRQVVGDAPLAVEDGAGDESQVVGDVEALDEAVDGGCGDDDDAGDDDDDDDADPVGSESFVASVSAQPCTCDSVMRM